MPIHAQKNQGFGDCNLNMGSSMNATITKAHPYANTSYDVQIVKPCPQMRDERNKQRFPMFLWIGAVI